MADGVLVEVAHLGERHVEAVGHEDGVVAEAAVADGFGEDDAIHAALELVALSVEDEGHHSLETGLAVADALHLLQQLVHIVLEGAMLAGVAGGVNARTAVEGFHLETGVIGKTVDLVFLVNVFGLLFGVTYQSISGFWYFIETADMVKAEHDTRSTRYCDCLL